MSEPKRQSDAEQASERSTKRPLIDQPMFDDLLTILVWSVEHAATLATEITPRTFETDVYRMIAQCAIEHIQENNGHPAGVHLINRIHKVVPRGEPDEFVKHVVNKMAANADKVQPEYVLRELARIKRLAEMGPVLDKLSDLRTAGQLEQAEALLTSFAHPPTIAPPAPEPPWPTLSEDALYGLAGKIVRAIEPYTEADRANLLFQLLTAFGNYVGRDTYCMVEENRHHGNLYMVLVGRTSKARKGTSWGRILAILGEADPQWQRDCLYTGVVGSGEGVIYRVRDGDGDDDDGDNNKPRDKRLCMMMSEFSSQLRILERTGTIIAGVLRDGWDQDVLYGPMIKNKQDKATGAHISIIGHITTEELRRYLTSTEIADGFANRYLFICAKRSQELPRPRPLPQLMRDDLSRQLHQAALMAPKGEIDFDAEAGALWDSIYGGKGGLSEEREGLIGMVTNRAEPQTRRLALIYTLLDGAKETRVEHLDAAVMAWRYARDSAEYIFGRATGDAVADTILAELRHQQNGITRSDMHGLFANNQSRARIDQALAALERQGYAKSMMQTSGQRGRPSAIWRAV